MTRIATGSLEPGVLGRADYADAEGRRVRVYQFSGRQNEPIILTLTGSNDSRTNGLSLNPYMQVFNLSAPEGQQYIGGTILPGESRILSDNPLVPVDNQLFLRLPDTGEYGVVVYTDPGAEGRFALSLLRDRTRYIQDVTGELTDQSPRLRSDNSPYEIVEFQANQGQTLHVDLSSPDFDPYLFLIAPDGSIVAEDDDSGGNFNARIVMELPQSGTYTAIVNSFSAEGRGRYRLTVY
ncbi:PPC domain-containing protein [Egbenema bharatensis]|uniref:PPC domain-containing protein n=1 Tax=Egbenema bharatensis TaxID=3463334 RepID=UPI003A8945D1